MILGGTQGFLEADAAERRSVRRAGAFPSGVFEPELDGIETEFSRQFVDHGLYAKRGDGRARAR